MWINTPNQLTTDRVSNVKLTRCMTDAVRLANSTENRQVKFRGVCWNALRGDMWHGQLAEAKKKKAKNKKAIALTALSRNSELSQP